MVNNEDGRLYRWHLPTNQLTQTVRFNNGYAESYTPTAIGAGRQGLRDQQRDAVCGRSIGRRPGRHAMDRRTFIVAAAAAYGCGQKEAPKTAATSTIAAEPPKEAPKVAAEPPKEAPKIAAEPHVPRVTILFFGSPVPAPPAASGSSSPSAVAFRRRLAELGHVEGKTVVVDEQYAGGDSQRLAELARALVASKVDIIVASGSTATAAARQATSTIPIVMANAGNPAGAGQIASLARPGGNVTGTTNIPLGGKHVDLMREIVPGMRRLAILANPTNPGAEPYVATAEAAATRHGIAITPVEVSRGADFPSAYAAITRAAPDALFVATDPLIVDESKTLIEFTKTLRLPAIYDLGLMVRRGGLIAYGPHIVEQHARAADHVDRILKGAKPGDLPVEQPARFELVINKTAANAIGLKLPASLLLRADSVVM